jgi:hypothetical protein
MRKVAFEHEKMGGQNLPHTCLLACPHAKKHPYVKIIFT